MNSWEIEPGRCLGGILDAERTACGACIADVFFMSPSVANADFAGKCFHTRAIVASNVVDLFGFRSAAAMMLCTNNHLTRPSGRSSIGFPI